MRILITGSEGFIGKNLQTRLADYYFDSWDSKLGKDIFDQSFEKAVKNHNTIIHLAAQTSVNGSFKDPLKHYVANTMGTARVVYLCQKYDKKLIFPSTGAVFHPDLSPYARSKYLAEEIVKTVMDKIPVVILRLFNVFGPYMNPDSGSIMYNFLNDKKITVYGTGEQTRDFIHVRDVTAIIKDALKKKWDGKIVEVGTGQAYTINYIAELFTFYRKKELIYRKAPKREIKWSIANISTLKSLYKRPLTTDIAKDVEELCKLTHQN